MTLLNGVNKMADPVIGVVITNAPSRIQPVGNPIVFEVQYASPAVGTAFVIEIGNVSATSDDDYFEISLADGTTSRIYCTGALSEFNTFLPGDSGSLISALAVDVIVAPRATVGAGSDVSLVGNTLDTSSDFTITCSNNAVTITITTASADPVFTNRYIGCNIIKLDPTLFFAEIDRIEGPTLKFTEPNQTQEFNINELMKKWIPDTYKPPVSMPYIDVAASDWFYLVEFYPIIGADQIIGKRVLSEIKQSYAGTFLMANFSHFNQDFENSEWVLASGQWKPLTNRTRFFVTKDEQTCLYFIDNDAGTGTTSVTIYDKDGSSYTGSLSSFATALPYCVFVAKTGFFQLGLTGIVSDPCRYILSFTNAAGSKTIDIEYILEEEEPNAVYFIYRNSMGGYDPLRATGAKEMGIEVDRDDFFKEITGYYSIEREMMRTDYISESEIGLKYTVFTGYKSKNEIISIAEILWSKEVYVNKSSGLDMDTLYPMIINKGSVRVYTDDDHRYGFVFEARHAFKDGGYTEW